MTKKKVIVTVVILLIVVGTVAGGVWGYKAYQTKNRTVEVQSVAMLNWGYWGDTESSYGMVTNDSAQEIYLDSSLTVKEVYVKQGDAVKVGDPLIAYDTADLDRNIQRKKLDINTTENNLAKARYQLFILQNSKPVDKTMPEMDEDKWEEYVKEDEKNNSVGEADAKDKRIYNYLTAGAIPYNASIDAAGNAVYPAGTAVDPYIYYCNEKVYAFGSFYNSIRPTAAKPTGIVVKIIVPQKDPDGKMVIDALTSLPVANTALSISEKVIDGASIPAEYDAEKMWYIFSGKERTPSDLAGQYRDEYLSDLENWQEPQGYTQQELVEAIMDMDQRIKELDISYRRQLLELESMEKSASDGKVYATVAGNVKTLGDVNHPKNDGTAFLVVAGDDGLYVSGTISELLLDDVTVGTVVTANSWESGMTFDATITEISDYPVNSNSWGDGNPNVSYYSYVAYIEDSTALRNGEYVDLTISINQTEAGSGIYMDMAYVREENGKYYCMVANENNRLEKRYVVTGKTVYGSAIEIKSGLTEEDRIAFPYGKEAVEGAAVTEPSNMYY